MLNWRQGKNRIALKLISLVMVQVFLATSIGYTAPLKDQSSIYIAHKSLRPILAFSSTTIEYFISPEYREFIQQAGEEYDVSYNDPAERVIQGLIAAAIRKWRSSGRSTEDIERDLDMAFPSIRLHNLVSVDGRGSFYVKVDKKYLRITKDEISEVDEEKFVHPRVLVAHRLLEDMDHAVQDAKEAYEQNISDKEEKLTEAIKLIKTHYLRDYFKGQENWTQAFSKLEELVNGISEEAARVAFDAMYFDGEISNAEKDDIIKKYEMEIGKEQVEYFKLVVDESKRQKKKFIFLNATFIGGGVADMYSPGVPLLRALGADIEWHILWPLDPAFYTSATKPMHNRIQSQKTPKKINYDLWKKANKENGNLYRRLFKQDNLVVLVDDPQPAPMISEIRKINKEALVLGRLHMDTSGTVKGGRGVEVWNELTKHWKGLDAFIHQPGHKGRNGVPSSRVPEFARGPALDLFSEQNKLRKGQDFKRNKRNVKDINALKDLKDDEGREVLEGEFYALAVGRADPAKGFIHGLMGFVEFLKENPDAVSWYFLDVSPDDPEGYPQYLLLKLLIEENETEFERLWVKYAEGLEKLKLRPEEISGLHKETITRARKIIHSGLGGDYRLKDHIQIFTQYTWKERAACFARTNAGLILSTLEGYNLALSILGYHRVPIVATDLPAFEDRIIHKQRGGYSVYLPREIAERSPLLFLNEYVKGYGKEEKFNHMADSYIGEIRKGLTYIKENKEHAQGIADSLHSWVKEKGHILAMFTDIFALALSTQKEREDASMKLRGTRSDIAQVDLHVLTKTVLERIKKQRGAKELLAKVAEKARDKREFARIRKGDAEKEISFNIGELQIVNLVKDMVNFGKDYHAHGTNSYALKEILKAPFDGKVLPPKEIEKRGGMILSKEPTKKGTFYEDIVNTINLQLSDRSKGHIGGYIKIAERYAREISAEEFDPYRTRYRIAPDSIGDAIEAIKKIVAITHDRTFKEKYIGRLSELEEIKRHFESLSLKERSEINRLSKIPVVIIGYDSSTKGASLQRIMSGTKLVNGEDAVFELTTIIIAVPEEHISEVQRLLEENGKGKTIKVIGMEQTSLLQDYYLAKVRSQGSTKSEIDFAGFIDMILDPDDVNRIRETLNCRIEEKDKESQTEALIQDLIGRKGVLSNIPFIGAQYSKSAFVEQEYTIGEHTTMVLRQFEKYFSDGKFEELTEGLNINKAFFRLILCLHDIGKYIARSRGLNEHEVTIDIMEVLLEKLGFKEEQVNLAKALLQNNAIGAYLKETLELDIRPEYIQAKADNAVEKIYRIYKTNKVDLPIAKFFQLLTVYYQVDASAYTKVAGGKESLDYLFEYENGQFKLNNASTRFVFSKLTETKFQLIEEYFMSKQKLTRGNFLSTLKEEEGRFLKIGNNKEEQRLVPSGYGVDKLLACPIPMGTDWSSRFNKASRKGHIVKQINVLEEVVSLVRMRDEWLDGQSELPSYILKHGRLNCLGNAILSARILIERVGIDEGNIFVGFSPKHVFIIVELSDGGYYFLDTSDGVSNILSGHIYNMRKGLISEKIPEFENIWVKLPDSFAKRFPEMQFIDVASLRDALELGLKIDIADEWVKKANEYLLPPDKKDITEEDAQKFKKALSPLNEAIQQFQALELYKSRAVYFGLGLCICHKALMEYRLEIIERKEAIDMLNQALELRKAALKLNPVGFRGKDDFLVKAEFYRIKWMMEENYKEAPDVLAKTIAAYEILAKRDSRWKIIVKELISLQEDISSSSLIGKWLDRRGRVIRENVKTILDEDRSKARFTYRGDGTEKTIAIVEIIKTKRKIQSLVKEEDRYPDISNPEGIDKINAEKMLRLLSLDTIKQVVKLKDDKNIRGFIDSDILYLSEFFFNPDQTINIIAFFHELGEGSSLSLPDGISKHTYLRGCGNDVRFVIYSLLQKGIIDETTEPEEIVDRIKGRIEELKIEKPGQEARILTESEKALILYNHSLDLRGFELTHGLQDKVFRQENAIFTLSLKHHKENVIKSRESIITRERRKGFAMGKARGKTEEVSLRFYSDKDLTEGMKKNLIKILSEWPELDSKWDIANHVLRELKSTEPVYHWVNQIFVFNEQNEFVGIFSCYYTEKSKDMDFQKEANYFSFSLNPNLRSMGVEYLGLEKDLFVNVLKEVSESDSELWIFFKRLGEDKITDILDRHNISYEVLTKRGYERIVISPDEAGKLYRRVTLEKVANLLTIVEKETREIIEKERDPRGRHWALEKINEAINSIKEIREDVRNHGQELPLSFNSAVEKLIELNTGKVTILSTTKLKQIQKYAVVSQEALHITRGEVEIVKDKLVSPIKRKDERSKGDSKKDLLSPQQKQILQSVKGIFEGVDREKFLRFKEKISGLNNGMADITRSISGKGQFDLCIYACSGGDISAGFSYSGKLVTIDRNDFFEIIKKHLVIDENWLKMQMEEYVENKFRLGMHSSAEKIGLIEYVAELMLIGVDLDTFEIIDDRKISPYLHMTRVKFKIKEGIFTHTHFRYEFEGHRVRDELMKSELTKIINQMINKNIVVLSKAGADIGIKGRQGGESKGEEFLQSLSFPTGSIIISDNPWDYIKNWKALVGNIDSLQKLFDKYGKYGYAKSAEDMHFYKKWPPRDTIKKTLQDANKNSTYHNL